MGSKSEAAYLAVTLKLRQCGVQVNNQTSDCELGIMNAFRRVYGQARGFRQTGCLFHHVVSVHEAVGRLALVEVMEQNEAARQALRRLCSLPRLPAADIGAGFRAAVQEVRRLDPVLYNQLYPLFAYYHREWLLIIRPSRLSVFGVLHATNNISEISHRDFWRRSHVAIPNVYDAIGKKLLNSNRLLPEKSLYMLKNIMIC
jgi:hypothetical protein